MTPELKKTSEAVSLRPMPQFNVSVWEATYRGQTWYVMATQHQPGALWDAVVRIEGETYNAKAREPNDAILACFGCHEHYEQDAKERAEMRARQRAKTAKGH